MTTPTTSRARRLAVVVASLASTAAVLASGAHQADAAVKPAPTKATITWTSEVVRVQVTSPKRVCKPNRRAFVFYNNGDHQAALRGVTGSNGVYTRSDAGYPSGGRLLAYIGKKRGCAPGQSNVVTMEDPPEAADAARAGERAPTRARLTYSGSSIKVKVTSPRASCTTSRRVELFVYQPGSESSFVITGTTNDNGVYNLDESSRRGFGAQSYEATAFTRKKLACAVGQSNTATLQP